MITTMTKFQLCGCFQNIKKSPFILFLLLMLVSLFIFLTSRQDLFIARDPQKMKSECKSLPFRKLNQQHQLLLVTKGRSGSSFTGNLINHDSSIFYVFEPLFVLDGTKPSNTKALQVLETFFSCNFQDSNHVSFLDNILFRDRGSELKQFRNCAKSQVSGFRHIECFVKLIEECRQKKTVFIKTIRLSMSLAKDLMLRMPNLKLLYLVRDPRAVLRSQAVVFRNFNWSQELHAKAERHCSGIADDLATIDRISGLLPGRIRLIRYESGAMDPIGYAKDIYKFVGLNFTEGTVAHVNAVTHGNKSMKLFGSSFDLMKPTKLESPWGLVRANTSEAMNHWRSSVNYLSVKSIDNVCRKVYSRFGYKKITSKKHLLSNNPLFESTFQQDV